MRVTTWNVLHRVHAMNWEPGSVAAFPDERVRNVAVAEAVAGWLAAGTDVVCLQEVSGDQLARLREAVGARAKVFVHAYPRVPRLRRAAPAPLEDPTEQLVVLARGGGACLYAERTFDADPGKGLLAVDLGGGVLVVDTHVSWGPRAAAQLPLLAEAASGQARVAIVTGDFNAPGDVVQRGLGAAFARADVVGPTRLGGTGQGGDVIDHVFVRGARVLSAEVLDEGGLSDHRPVTAELG